MENSLIDYSLTHTDTLYELNFRNGMYIAWVEADPFEEKFHVGVEVEGIRKYETTNSNAPFSMDEAIELSHSWLIKYINEIQNDFSKIEKFLLGVVPNG